MRVEIKNDNGEVIGSWDMAPDQYAKQAAAPAWPTPDPAAAGHGAEAKPGMLARVINTLTGSK